MQSDFRPAVSGLSGLLCIWLCSWSPDASAQRVNVSSLANIDFTSIRPGVESRRALPLCVFSDTPSHLYSVTLNGSGPGGAFELDDGGDGVLPYSVQWSDRGQSSAGIEVRAGSATGPLPTTAEDPTCASGAGSTATMIVTLRGQDTARATGGTPYAGTLSITIAPN